MYNSISDTFDKLEGTKCKTVTMTVTKYKLQRAKNVKKFRIWWLLLVLHLHNGHFGGYCNADINFSHFTLYIWSLNYSLLLSSLHYISPLYEGVTNCWIGWIGTHSEH